MTGASSEAIYDASIPPEQQIVQYKTKDGEIKTISKADLQDQLEASERLMASVSETWEDKLVRTQEIQKEREDALEALGITIEKNLVGVHTPKKVCNSWEGAAYRSSNLNHVFLSDATLGQS